MEFKRESVSVMKDCLLKSDSSGSTIMYLGLDIDLSEDLSLLVTFLLVTFSWFFSWLFRGPHLPRKTVFVAFS